jgi:hypothetical protein
MAVWSSTMALQYLARGLILALSWLFNLLIIENVLRPTKHPFIYLHRIFIYFCYNISELYRNFLASPLFKVGHHISGQATDLLVIQHSRNKSRQKGKPKQDFAVCMFSITIWFQVSKAGTVLKEVSRLSSKLPRQRLGGGMGSNPSHTNGEGGNWFLAPAVIP